MKKLQIFLVSLFLTIPFFVNSQETLPIYSDYLSDNVYLVHPSAAGIGNCGKVRLTGRTQWSGIPDAPALQTLSGHMRVGTNAGVGVILFNDKNGYHSQQGIQGTYAYHIDLGRPEDAHQLSFGLSLMAVNNSVDQRSFEPSGDLFPIIRNESYFNSDVSFAYHNKGLFSYFTAKNVLFSARSLYDDRYESMNLRRYLATVGYYFGQGKNIQFEPSIMGQAIELTGEKFVDFNLKVYKKMNESLLWAAISYRRGFDNSPTEELQYVTPIVGVNYKNFMVSYTYTKQSGDILFEDAGYHQITLGFNFGCREPRRSGCPNLNGSF